MMMLNLKEVLSKVLRCCYKMDTKVKSDSNSSITWRIRKYADGTVVCWGTKSSQNYAMTSASGYGYYTSSNVALPDGLFKYIDYATCQRSGGATSNYLISTNIQTVTTSLLTYFVWNTTSATASVAIAFLVKGRWK